MKKSEIISYLQKNEKVFWIGDCHGKWDLIIGVWSKSLEDFFYIHDEFMNNFSEFVLTKEVSISRFNLQFNRRWMYNDNEEVKEFNFGEKESLISLDDDDKKILKELSTNSRIKIIDISRKTKILPDKIKYRLKSLEKKGVIKGYKCLLNAKKLGYIATKVNIYFKSIDQNKKMEFFEFIKQMDNSIYIVETFASWDVEVGFEVESHDSFYNIIDRILEKYSHIIKHYDEMYVLNEFKQDFILLNEK
jgi:DNA-binding Lrp family transcriptional regulator